ncbi:MAG TPA: 6-carboxytetrahydropterin synthase QueD [Acidimicrobiales bacterium]|nr:6-carboxytetrahydropterin synthase QueD [Acidimicrobiales bacterium]
MRTTVTRVFTFEAAHQLPWHSGACRELHGHGYRLEVTVAGPLNADGIVIDFADLRDVIEREVLSRYDHKYLNDLLDNPTAELIAQDAWKVLEAAGVTIDRLRLWETADCSVEIVRE